MVFGDPNNLPHLTQRQKEMLTAVHNHSVMSKMYEDELDLLMEQAIDMGVSFTDLGRAIDRTEAAVRLKAARKGWYEPGTRKRGIKAHVK